MQYAPGGPKVSPVIWKREQWLDFGGNLITLLWLSTSQPSHTMHFSVASVWSIREGNNKIDHQ
jgi:hypothetical protein